MNFVKVNGANLAALGTKATENFLHLAVQHICRNLLSNAEEVTIREALIVAKPLSARTHPTDNYG